MTNVNTSNKYDFTYFSGNLISERKEFHIMRMSENRLDRAILLPEGDGETNLQKCGENYVQRSFVMCTTE